MDVTKPQRLLKPSQVAGQLQMSVFSVYRMIARGDLPAVRLGTSARAPLRVDPDELERFLYGEASE